jgi:hypothetical protein
VYGNRISSTGTVRGTARRPHFSLAIISETVQLWIYVFWVITVYFNIRNTLPKSGTFLLGHSVFIKQLKREREKKDIMQCKMLWTLKFPPGKFSEE